MRSGNPILNSAMFDIAGADADPMTLGATVNKSAMALALVLITAVWTWGRYSTTQDPASIAPWMWGGISAHYESQFPGIVNQAVGLTFGTLFCLLTAYKSGLVRATGNFKLGVVAATGAIAILYLLDVVLDFDFIESGVERGAPKYMEWYGAFGLIVTLVWLYLEILRLLGKSRK